MSAIWETAVGGKDKGCTLEIADYSMFSGSAVFVMFLRSDEWLSPLGKERPHSETRDLSCFPSRNEAAQPDTNVNRAEDTGCFSMSVSSSYLKK